ncbi:hypothetical protein RUND412_007562 [Rhizina undulata]
MPPKFAARAPRKRSTDKADERQPKRTKTSTSKVSEAGTKGKDDEGNSYWELGGRLRRVTVSEFKGKSLISIREHYEKDGKILPGKKGISLSVEQFNALLSVLPQIEGHLGSKDVELVRPEYNLSSTAAKEEGVEMEEESEKEEEAAAEEDEEEFKPKKTAAKQKKSEVKTKGKEKAKKPKRVESESEGEDDEDEDD